MTGIKCCPKCGSINVNPLVFYRPSIWRCLDCGYEGAFIIEDCGFAEQMQGRFGGRFGVIDLVEGERRMEYWDGSADSWPKT